MNLCMLCGNSIGAPPDELTICEPCNFKHGWHPSQRKEKGQMKATIIQSTYAEAQARRRCELSGQCCGTFPCSTPNAACRARPFPWMRVTILALLIGVLSILLFG